MEGFATHIVYENDDEHLVYSVYPCFSKFETLKLRLSIIYKLVINKWKQFKVVEV